MQFTNINIFSILIFIILFWFIAFLAYIKYLSQTSFNNKFKLLKSSRNFFIKYVFLFLAVIVLLFSILWIKYWTNNESVWSEWIDVMFVLDVSKSMNVADINDGHYRYTRLDIAKKAIWDYIVKHDNNRYWLVIFAWDAISTIPLTSDYNLFLTMLSWVDYRNLTVQGSDFKKALDLAINRFVWDKDRSKAIVFISDWWDVWDKIEVPDNIKKDIVYYVVWVWTESGGKIMKWVDVFWRPIYQKYKWQYVISKLNSDNLEKLASLLNWEYFKLEDVWDLKKLDKELSKLKTKAIKKKNSKELNNFSRNLAIFSLIFFMIFLGIYLNIPLAPFQKGLGMLIFYIKPELLKLWKK